MDRGKTQNVGIMEIKEKLEKWQAAKLAVADNAKIMCGNPTEEDVKFCADSMKALYNAKEDLILACGGLKDSTQEIVQWLETLKDKGCNSCWLTSNPIKLHEGCKKKIDRYFKVEEDLYNYKW